MPSLIRLILALGLIFGIIYGTMYALTIFVEPKPREINIRIPSEKVNRE